MFSCEYCKVSKNTHFEEHLQTERILVFQKKPWKFLWDKAFANMKIKLILLQWTTDNLPKI